MLSLRRPSLETLESYREACQSRPLNAPGLSVGSLERPPVGFVRDRYGATLGAGPSCYAAARAAFDDWAMYPRGWTWVHAGPGGQRVGAVYVALIRGYGVYTSLPGRVLESFDGTGEERRWGFTFATLVGHLEQGVERFEIRWSPVTDAVRFEACAVSRPGPWLRPVAPLARRLQRRFHAESPEAMRSAVAARRR